MANFGKSNDKFRQILANEEARFARLFSGKGPLLRRWAMMGNAQKVLVRLDQFGYALEPVAQEKIILNACRRRLTCIQATARKEDRGRLLDPKLLAFEGGKGMADERMRKSAYLVFPVRSMFRNYATSALLPCGTLENSFMMNEDWRSAGRVSLRRSCRRLGPQIKNPPWQE